ncbi:MAG: hypothetical protein ACOCG6_01230 [Candidatus Cloacimonadaceae bacterium]
MLFLKSLIFIPWNILLGMIVLWILRWILFNPKPIYIFKKKCFLTPGFLVRKRDWLFNKARDLLFDYLHQAENANLKDGYLAKWEKKVHDFIWEKSEFVSEWRFLPAKFKQSIRRKITDGFTKIASNFLRKRVPRLAEQWRIEHRIDDYDFQFSMDFFRDIYNRYVHKFMVLGFLAINLLIGINNLILYILMGLIW